MIAFTTLIIVFFIGLLFQFLLHGPSRMLISAFVGFLGGIVAGFFGNYIPLAFALGCFGRMVIGWYVVCIVLMGVYIGIGFAVGYYVL